MLILQNRGAHSPQGLKRKSQPLFILTHEFHPQKGGIATFTEEMALSCSQQGFDVEVWAPENGGEVAEKPWPFKVRRLDMKGTQDLSCLMTTSREIIEKRRDLRNAIVYLPEPGPISAMLYLQFFKAFKPGRLYLTFHGSEILNYHGKIHHRMLLKKLIRKADRVSAVSTYTHRLLVSHFPEASHKTVLTPCALRSDFVGTKHRKAPDKDKVIILTVGRLHPRKGQTFILKTLNLLPDHIKAKIEFWMVGNGKHIDYQNEIQSLMDKSEITVKMLGQLDDTRLREVYEQADIFAMTSIHYKKSIEGFGLVYLEASAHGLPVVASHIGGVSDAVAHNKTGLLVAPGNKPALANAFIKLIEDPELRTTMGEAGRRWVGKYRWDKSVEMLFSREEIVFET
ncbi:MAG: glycosyltransferase family 4 protein [Verrucomicrobia bacterium]|nr:glycosyltransferase family 4 protein [Verrucomicrobiota bacterium]MDA1068030.1 glycosyltransferase family 4 protein [Verrucomicrobiota bacterium]